jgi:hypothetical protein
VDDLGQEDEGAQEDHLLFVGKEVGEREVEEEAEVEEDVEGSQFLAHQLRVVQVGDVLTAPHEEQQLHVEDDEQHDVG